MFKNILVVDSMAEFERVGELLRHDNICALVAWDAERARNMLAQPGFLKSIDLILMNYDLGILEAIGADLTKEFRAAGFAKPIVANSANNASNKLLVEAGCVEIGSDLRQGIVRLLRLG